MKYLKNFKKYLESLEILNFIDIDLNESLNSFYQNIMQSIGAEEVDFYDTFKIDKSQDIYGKNLDIVNNSSEFINSLSSIGLKNSYLQSTEDIETFVNKPCRFVMIYRIEANELENPNYIVFQSWDDSTNNWENIKLYKVTGDIKAFYDKLTSKVIEILDGEDNYIYQSSNRNEWILQNVEKESEKFKKYFRKDEFERFIKDNNFKFDIK